jgi:hypothetical protein
MEGIKIYLAWDRRGSEFHNVVRIPGSYFAVLKRVLVMWWHVTGSAAPCISCPLKDLL